MIYKRYLKRIFDITGAIVLLPILLILIMFIGLAIYIDDCGPVFYIDKRVGLNGNFFNMIKFRTMKVNSPDIRLNDGSTFSSSDDKRVTRIGKLLRKTSIDETPQILNVLKGDMSFIGPRPDPQDWLDKYPDEYIDFLKCRPGITGYNQAYFRNSSDGLEKMKNDLYYSQNFSFFFDLKIFLKTLETVLLSRNTNKE